MANWWDVAPLADAPKPAATGGNWWEAAPLAKSDRPAVQSVGTGEALARGAAQGLTAGFYDEARALTSAGSNPNEAPSAATGERREGIDQLIMGLAKYWFGNENAQAKYDEAVKGERAFTKAAEEQHPIASTVGNIAGAVAMPLGAGAGAVTLPARMARGAGVGAALGGIGGVGEGEGLTDSITKGLSGAAVGGILGGVAPAAVEGIIRGGRAVAQPVVNAIRGIADPEAEAGRRVVVAMARDIEADPNAVSRLTPQEYAASVQSGGPATIMDLGGETTRALARSAGNTSTQGREALNQTINNRFEGQGPRVTEWLRQTFHYPDAAAQSEAIQQVARNVNTPRYARAFGDGARGVWSPELQRLAGAPAIQEAARAASPGLANRGITEGFQAPRRNPLVVDPQSGRVSLRTSPNGNQTVPDLRFWDQVKRNLDSEIGKANRAGDAPRVGELTGLKNTLLQELDRVVPSYQQARAGAAHFFGAQDALEAGQNFVSKNMTSADARRALAQMSPQERQLFQDGFVSRYIDTLNQIGDRRSVLNKIAESPAAREKLRIALGPQRAQELEAGLRVEGIMDLARGAVQGNSTTARQLAELGLAGGTYGIATGGNLLNPDPTAMMQAALVYGAARGKGRIDSNVARRVAEMLTSNDPRAIQRGVQIVTRNTNLFNSLRRADQGLARIGGSQASGVPAFQAAGVGRAEDQQDVPRPPGQ